MKYEIISVIGLLLCLLVIGIEYVMLYRMAEYQDDRTERITALKHRLKIRIEGILYAPTDSCRSDEIKSLNAEINGDHEVYELSMQMLREYRDRNEGEDAAVVDRMIDDVNAEVDPVSIYLEMLDSKSVYHKSYACRRLADLGAAEQHDKITEYLDHKNRDLSYNAAMALARFGDADSIAEYILNIQNDRNYSGRIVNEFIDDFGGNRADLAAKLFEKCNPYMKCTVIKAIAQYKLTEFHDMYVSGSTGNDLQLKIACVKALAEFGRPEDEQILQMAAKDKQWVIRASAVRGLSLLGTQSALKTVKHALSDKEWWVRQAAAGALVKMNVTPKDLEDILGGYDRFAADAVKNVLYRSIG